MQSAVTVYMLYFVLVFDQLTLSFLCFCGSAVSLFQSHRNHDVCSAEHSFASLPVFMRGINNLKEFPASMNFPIERIRLASGIQSIEINKGKTQ